MRIDGYNADHELNNNFTVNKRTYLSMKRVIRMLNDGADYTEALEAHNRWMKTYRKIIKYDILEGEDA